MREGVNGLLKVFIRTIITRIHLLRIILDVPSSVIVIIVVSFHVVCVIFIHTYINSSYYIQILYIHI